MLQEGTNQMMDNLCAVEEVAEEILADRQQIVNLNRKRNQNREALRALAKEMGRTKTEKSTWVCFGNMFLKMNKEAVQDQLHNDQDMLDKEVDNVHNGLKFKLDKLRDLEGKPELQGFHLQPLSNQEMMVLSRGNQ